MAKKMWNRYIETDAKKSELVFQAIMAIKNGFRAFKQFTKSFIIKNSFQNGKIRFCSSTGS